MLNKDKYFSHFRNLPSKFLSFSTKSLESQSGFYVFLILMILHIQVYLATMNQPLKLQGNLSFEKGKKVLVYLKKKKNESTLLIISELWATLENSNFCLN